jgi:hypothetical protein
MFIHTLFSDTTPSEFPELAKRIEAELDAVQQALTAEVAADLLDSTARARQAAWYYLQGVERNIDNLEVYWNDLKGQASAKQLKAARNSLRTSVLSIEYNSSSEEDRAYYAYQVASLLMTLHADDQAPVALFSAGADPHEDIQVAWCLQFLAGWLYDCADWDAVFDGN